MVGRSGVRHAAPQPRTQRALPSSRALRPSHLCYNLSSESYSESSLPPRKLAQRRRMTATGGAGPAPRVWDGEPERERDKWSIRLAVGPAPGLLGLRRCGRVYISRALSPQPHSRSRTASVARFLTWWKLEQRPSGSVLVVTRSPSRPVTRLGLGLIILGLIRSGPVASRFKLQRLRVRLAG